jgi:hypothetical protein
MCRWMVLLQPALPAADRHADGENARHAVDAAGDVTGLVAGRQWLAYVSFGNQVAACSCSACARANSARFRPRRRERGAAFSPDGRRLALTLSVAPATSTSSCSTCRA